MKINVENWNLVIFANSIILYGFWLEDQIRLKTGLLLLDFDENVKLVKDDICVPFLVHCSHMERGPKFFKMGT